VPQRVRGDLGGEPGGLGGTAQRVFRLRPDCLCHRADPSAAAIKPGS